MKKKRFTAHLHNIKWEILKKSEAEVYGLRLINIDDNNVLLEVDIDKIPRGWDIEKFLYMIEYAGIVFRDRFKER